jgi:hypothetical protein
MSIEEASPVPEGADTGSVSERRAQQVAITCSACTAEWTGLTRAHCAALGCHQTFASVALFDAHRSAAGLHGACLAPAHVLTKTGKRVMELRDGVWRGPAMTREQIEKAWPKKAEVSE